MNYSEILTSELDPASIERVNWVSFLPNTDLIWEFNCLMSPEQIFKSEQRDIGEAAQVVAVGCRRQNKSKLVRETVYQITSPGVHFSKDAQITRDLEKFNIPDSLEDWDISYSTNQKYNYAVATKELSNGIICVNIALFGTKR